MKTESCRDWRESLGAYALGHLSPEERAVLEAHLDGCPDCRAEADSLAFVARLLPHADPQHFGPAPAPISRARRADRGERSAPRNVATSSDGRFRLGLALCGATAAIAAAALCDLPSPRRRWRRAHPTGRVPLAALRRQDYRRPDATILRYRDQHVRQRHPLRDALSRLPADSRRSRSLSRNVSLPLGRR